MGKSVDKARTPVGGQVMAYLFTLSLMAATYAGAAIVEMTGQHRFVPAKLTVRVGEEVEFKNTSSRPHTVTADRALVKDPRNVILPQGAASFHSGTIVPGGRFVQRFEVPGLYQYVCLPHEIHGMIGRVEVLGVEEDEIQE